MRTLSFITLFVSLFGCAQGRVDVLDHDGNVVGYCSADFNFHWYGAQDSVNYILYLCAKENIDKAFRISDESILADDYTIPEAPEGRMWSKKLAKKQFSKDLISEEKLGYILASVEFQYWAKLQEAKDDLSRSAITKEEYEKLVEKANSEFEGV
ncbi:hypothetical protein [Microbulbifer halophilus]|uniref:Uncharacterized protein n=1 Tax=Microbulbifer halophilus TaxID=453963 RepID=A0ABW5EF60_9GAMM|nr:hypothetical protein [Microbulbifer halophilus]MCW8128374.1 hypothetical protein [Microbulbifer halophilus]